VSLIEPPPYFNLASLVQEAAHVELSEVAFDDLENNLLLPSFPQKPKFLKRPLTPPIPILTPARVDQSYRNKKRALMRKKGVIEEGHTAKPRTLFEHVQLADKVEAAIDLKVLPVAKGGYSGLRFIRDLLGLKKEYTLEGLADHGITTLEWDGM
jgi:hypothetical protein